MDKKQLMAAVEVDIKKAIAEKDPYNLRQKVQFAVMVSSSLGIPVPNIVGEILGDAFRRIDDVKPISLLLTRTHKDLSLKQRTQHAAAVYLYLANDKKAAKAKILENLELDEARLNDWLRDVDVSHVKIMPPNNPWDDFVGVAVLYNAHRRQQRSKNKGKKAASKS